MTVIDKRLNELETRPAFRFDATDPDQEGNKNTKFADLIIDGKSLYQRLKKHDLIPALGWGCREYQLQMIDYFLLRLRDYPTLHCTL